MADVTVLPSVITLTPYVTYYSITASRNLYMVVQAPISSYGAFPGLTFSLGVGVSIVIPNAITTFHTIPAVAVRVFSSPGSIRPPAILPNNRPSGSSLDRRQLIPLRKAPTADYYNLMQKYRQGEQTVENLTTLNKKSYAQTVSSGIDNTENVKVILRSLINNYGFKSNKNNIPTSVRGLKKL